MARPELTLFPLTRVHGPQQGPAGPVHLSVSGAEARGSLREGKVSAASSAFSEGPGRLEEQRRVVGPWARLRFGH